MFSDCHGLILLLNLHELEVYDHIILDPNIPSLLWFVLLNELFMVYI
jgi:hypothetical protein